MSDLEKVLKQSMDEGVKHERSKIGKLNQVLGDIHLTQEEEKTLLWLSGCDDSTLDNMISILLKMKSQVFNNIGNFNNNPPHPNIRYFIYDFLKEQGLTNDELNNILGFKQGIISELCDTGAIYFEEFEILCEYLKKSGKLDNLDKEYWLRHYVLFKDIDDRTGEEYSSGSRKPYLDKLDKYYFQEEIQFTINELMEEGYSAKYILDKLEIMRIQIYGLRVFWLFAGETIDIFLKPVSEAREKVKMEMKKSGVVEADADEFYPFCD